VQPLPKLKLAAVGDGADAAFIKPRCNLSCLHADIRAHDRHSAKIEQNRNGLRNGVQSKRAAGVITEAQVAEINAIIDAAELREFRPLLYVIPYSPIVNLLKPVAISERASLYHEEYLIEQLPRFLFEVVELLEV